MNTEKELNFNKIEQNLENYSGPELDAFYAMLEKSHKRKARELRKLIDAEIAYRIIEFQAIEFKNLAIQAYAQTYNTTEDAAQEILKNESMGYLGLKKEFHEKLTELGLESGFFTHEKENGFDLSKLL